MKSFELPSRRSTRHTSLFCYVNLRPCDHHLAALRLSLRHLPPVATAHGVLVLTSWSRSSMSVSFASFPRMFSLAKVTSVPAHLLLSCALRQPLYPDARLLCRRCNTESVEIVAVGLVQTPKNGQTTRLVFCLTPPMAVTCRFPSQSVSTYDQGHKMRGIQTVAP